MLNLILASHGELASGIKKSLKILIGDDSKYINTVELYEDTVAELFYENLEKKLVLDESIINVIVVDLPGGTPSNQAIILSANHKNIEVISTINTPLIIELLLSRKEINSKDDLDLILSDTRESIKNLTEEFRRINEE